MPVPGGTTRKLSKARLAPAQEGVALAVALELDLHVLAERIGRAEIVDHDRMVDDEIDRRERIDALGVAAELAIASRIAARSTTAGTPVKSCISTRAGRNAISRSDLAVLEPGGHRLDVVDRDGAAVFEPHQIFEQHLQRKGQARNIAQTGRLGRRLRLK